MSRIRRILHATDFSPASRGAFMKAVELAKANGADSSPSNPIVAVRAGFAAAVPSAIPEQTRTDHDTF